MYKVELSSTWYKSKILCEPESRLTCGPQTAARPGTRPLTVLCFWAGELFDMPVARAYRIIPRRGRPQQAARHAAAGVRLLPLGNNVQSRAKSIAKPPGRIG